MHRRDIAALITLAALWGSSFLFIRIGAPALGPFPLAFGRVTLAALVLWGVARARQDTPMVTSLLGKLVILGALNAAIPFSLIARAELHLTASLTAMLNATVPLWAALMGSVWLGERITLRRALGLALGIAGVAVLVGWSPTALSATTWWSVGAVLLATASYAGAGVYTKKSLSGVSTATLSLGQQIGAALCLVLPAASQAPKVHATADAIGAVVVLAVFCTALAYPLYFRLIRTIGPTRTTTVTYLIPLFGTLWGVVFLREPVSSGMFLGLALILVSVGFANDVRVRMPGLFARASVAMDRQ
ncbi:MAG: DMT family transporter [Gemmatimonadaceae bacterium]|nr:DMT family transporter [Gemmatimonadaceae bacterium]